LNGPVIDPLLPGLAAGDERAFAELYDRYAGRLYRAAWGLLGRREDAEDVVQDVFLATVRAHHSLAGVRDLTSYLFTALHRAAGRCAQRRSRAPEPSATAADEAAAPAGPTKEDHPQWYRLQRAIQALPSEQREVLALRIDGELTFAQIAAVLGVSLGTAASRYRYAIQKLRSIVVSGGR
jgi:RNA polymerase sigma-70 factor (ECF subfamily)